MITAIEIENFKSIGSPGIRLEVAPLTLLFGPNSAGKSTILQALQYLRQLIQDESKDTDHIGPTTGGLEVGGFRRLVHHHNLDLPIRIRVEHEPKTPFDFWLWEHFIEEVSDRLHEIPSEYILKDLIHRLVMEVEVRWSHSKAAPYIHTYRVGINDEWAFRITGAADMRFVWVDPTRFEWVMFGRVEEDYPDAPPDCRQHFYHLDACGSAIPSAFDSEQRRWAGRQRRSRVIPDPLERELHAACHLPFEPSTLRWSGSAESENPDYQEETYRLLSALVIAPVYLTWRELDKLCYIGPIRDIPARQPLWSSAQESPSWYRGAGAWKHLLDSDASFVAETSDWLSQSYRLNTGYGIRTQSVVELTDDVLTTRLQEGEDLALLADLQKKLRALPRQKRVVFVREGEGVELAPCEVGTGLSQLVPVIVAALNPARRMVAIEQPELHVHPAVQVGLGDLFIRAIQSDYDEEAAPMYGVEAPPLFLIETHSEHLILRILRRIEETTDGYYPEHLKGIRPDEVSVNYLYTDAEKGTVRLVRLRIDERGEFIDKWPHGFFAERGDELFR